MLKDRIRSDQSVILQIILLLVILQLAVALLTDGFALSFDEAMWHYIGRNWFRNGLAPYSGGVDNKSPLIFAVFGLSDKLFGVNYWFPRVLGTVVQSVGIHYVYKIAKYVADHRTGIFAVSIYGLSLLWHGTGGKYVSYTETYEVTFIILAFYKSLTAQNKGDMFVSGLLAGIAIAFRLTAVFAVAAILIGCVRKNRSFIFPFCTGTLSALGCLLLIAFFAGINIRMMLDHMVLDNFTSGSATDHSFAWKLHNFADKFIWSAMPIFYPFLSWYLFFKRRVDPFVLWFVFALIGIAAVGIFDAVHLKEVLPPLAIMSAACIGYFIDNYKLSPAIFVVAMTLIFFPKSMEQVRNIKLLFSEKPKTDQVCSPPYTIPGEGTRKLLGQWVRDNTNPSDMVFVAGFGAQVQVYTERISPTIYFNVTQTPAARQRFYSDMKHNKPAMVLVPLFPEYKQQVGADLCNFVDSLVTVNYRLMECRYNYNVYRIK